MVHRPMVGSCVGSLTIDPMMTGKRTGFAQRSRHVSRLERRHRANCRRWSTGSIAEATRRIRLKDRRRRVGPSHRHGLGWPRQSGRSRHLRRWGWRAMSVVGARHAQGGSMGWLLMSTADHPLNMLLVCLITTRVVCRRQVGWRRRRWSRRAIRGGCRRRTRRNTEHVGRRLDRRRWPLAGAVGEAAVPRRGRPDSRPEHLVLCADITCPRRGGLCMRCGGGGIDGGMVGRPLGRSRRRRGRG